MRRMLDFIREFKFGRPQQIAALLLLAFIAISVVYEVQVKSEAPEILGGVNHDFDRGHLIAPIWKILTILHVPVEWKLFLPGLAFGLSLAGALWWVTRRLYDDEGGYVALALFCFSVPILLFSSRQNLDIIAAWGLYGLIYTAIGVAHTLYAPPRKWRPRILLLGVALGVTAGAYFAAALVGLIFAIGFMLYLAPGRRKEALGIIAIAGGIAVVFVVALYGFDLHAFTTAITSKEAWAISVHRGDPVVPGPQWLLLGVFTLIALITYAAWKRARYFGNSVPLLVMTVLFMVHHDGAQAAIWALPFVFTFIGGVFADLLETRRRKIVAWSLGSALAGYAALAIAAVLTIPK
jgi:hypothetical protein